MNEQNPIVVANAGQLGQFPEYLTVPVDPKLFVRTAYLAGALLQELRWATTQEEEPQLPATRQSVIRIREMAQKSLPQEISAELCALDPFIDQNSLIGFRIYLAGLVGFMQAPAQLSSDANHGIAEAEDSHQSNGYI